MKTLGALTLTWVFWTQATGWMAFPAEVACRAALEAVEVVREDEHPSLRALAAVSCREVEAARVKELTGR